MSLSDELAKLRVAGDAAACRTCHWYDQQPEDVRAEFDACIADPSVSNNSVRKACAGHGLTVSREQFNVHFRDQHRKSES